MVRLVIIFFFITYCVLKFTPPQRPFQILRPPWGSKFSLESDTVPVKIHWYEWLKKMSQIYLKGYRTQNNKSNILICVEVNSAIHLTVYFVQLQTFGKHFWPILVKYRQYIFIICLFKKNIYIYTFLRNLEHFKFLPTETSNHWKKYVQLF